MWSGRSRTAPLKGVENVEKSKKVVVGGFDNVSYAIYSEKRHSSKPKCWELVQSLLFLFCCCGAIGWRLTPSTQTHKRALRRAPNIFMLVSSISFHFIFRIRLFGDEFAKWKKALVSMFKIRKRANIGNKTKKYWRQMATRNATTKYNLMWSFFMLKIGAVEISDPAATQWNSAKLCCSHNIMRRCFMYNCVTQSVARIAGFDRYTLALLISSPHILKLLIPIFYASRCVFFFLWWPQMLSTRTRLGGGKTYWKR